MKKIWRYIIHSLAVFVLLLPGVRVAAEEGLGEDMEAPPALGIYAVNAGFSGEDGSTQNWDFVEIYNLAGEPVSLKGYSLVYVNSADNETMHSFSEWAVLNAEFLSVGYGSSPQFKEAGEDYAYRFNMAATEGTVRLVYEDEVVDEVCWGSARCVDKYDRFMTKEAENLSLTRCFADGVFGLCENGRLMEARAYFPEVNFEAIYYDLPEEEVVEPVCAGLVFSEIYSYFEVGYDEQFVEIHNPMDEIIVMDGCVLRYKKRDFALGGEMLPGGYLAYQNAELKLTKDPSSENVVELVDADGSVAASLTYYKGQKKTTTFALFGADEDGVEIWQRTYARTPGEENVYQEFRSCPAGKVINPLTGNCINFFEEEPLLACPAGKFRNPETNRCRSYETLTTILKPCRDGYYRSPETNRCRKVAVEEGPAPCREGYERNPDTGRCRMIRENNGADYGVEPATHSDESSFVAYGAIVAVVGGGVIYVVLQFRHEVAGFFRKRFKKRGKM